MAAYVDSNIVDVNVISFTDESILQSIDDIINSLKNIKVVAGDEVSSNTSNSENTLEESIIQSSKNDDIFYSNLESTFNSIQESEDKYELLNSINSENMNDFIYSNFSTAVKTIETQFKNQNSIISDKADKIIAALDSIEIKEGIADTTQSVSDINNLTVNLDLADHIVIIDAIQKAFEEAIATNNLSAYEALDTVIRKISESINNMAVNSYYKPNGSDKNVNIAELLYNINSKLNGTLTVQDPSYSLDDVLNQLKLYLLDR